jgi:hypothetical protein
MIKIRTFMNGWNDRCQPFTWTKTADQILQKANRFLHRQSPARRRSPAESWITINCPSIKINLRAAKFCSTRLTAGRDPPTMLASSVCVSPKFSVTVWLSFGTLPLSEAE